MTQAFNLALLANNVNSSGQLNADAGIYNTVNVANGGTNLSATPTDGQLLIGDGSGYTLATLTAGSGIAVTNSAGGISIAAPAAGGTRGQIFTSTGTFTVPSGVTSVKVYVAGGGGNGGLASGTNSTTGGGGGGGLAIKYITGLTPGATITATVGGVAGTSSFGAYCSATGGATAPTASATNAVGAGGAGGTATGGDINLSGGAGSTSVNYPGYGSIQFKFHGSGGGCGGQPGRLLSTNNGGWDNNTGTSWSYFTTTPGGAGLMGGAGGAALANTGVQAATGAYASVDTAGGAATGYGNGGGGASAASATDRAGGAGTGGIIVVEW